MAIPTVKYDGKNASIDEFFAGHQIERPANEGWVTIKGHHILLGDPGEQLAGKHEKLKKFIDQLPKSMPSDNTVLNTGFLDKINPTGEAFNFAQAAGSFSRTAYKFMSDYSYEMNAKGRTAEELKSEYADKAALLNDAIRISEPQDGTVYRGVGSLHNHPSLDNIKVGDEYNMGGIKSFSWDKQVALDMVTNAPNAYLFELKGPMKGVSIAALSDYPKEQEFISQGKFKVTKVDTFKGPQTHFPGTAPVVKHIVLEQTGIF